MSITYDAMNWNELSEQDLQVLALLLVDAVEDGASVGFLPPLEPPR